MEEESKKNHTVTWLHLLQNHKHNFTHTLSKSIFKNFDKKVMSCPYGHHLKKKVVGDEKEEASPRELTRRQSEERFREAKDIRLHQRT